jgi:hypothetical protein
MGPHFFLAYFNRGRLLKDFWVGPQKNRREKKTKKEAPSQTRRKKPENEKSYRSFFIIASFLFFLGGKMPVFGKK